MATNCTFKNATIPVIICWNTSGKHSINLVVHKYTYYFPPLLSMLVSRVCLGKNVFQINIERKGKEKLARVSTIYYDWDCLCCSERCNLWKRTILKVDVERCNMSLDLRNHNLKLYWKSIYCILPSSFIFFCFFSFCHFAFFSLELWLVRLSNILILRFTAR